MIRIFNLLALVLAAAAVAGCGSNKGRATIPQGEISTIGPPTAAGAGGNIPSETAK